ncbi:MAG: hypothetical protein WBA84_03895 [Carnobacterium sp.]
MDLKEELFNQLFEKKVKRHATSQDGAYVDVSIRINNKALKSNFDNLYKKYKPKHSYSDFINECILHSWHAIQRFEIRDDGNWEEIIAGTDKANIGRLINNIKISVKFEIIKFQNQDVKYTRGTVDGEKGQHVSLKFNMNSLDSILVSADGTDSSLVDVIGADSAFWGIENVEYKANHFIKWFNENKERILYKSQINFLDDLPKAMSVEGYTPDDVYKITGTASHKVNTKLRRIESTILKVWLKENPLGQKSLLQMEKEEELALWADLMVLMNEDPSNQNEMMSEWLLAHFDNEKVANIIYDNANVEESITVTRLFKGKNESAIKGSVLYKVMAKVESRIDKLEAFNPVIKAVSKPINTKAKEYLAKKSSWDKSDTFVYDRQGELIKKLPFKETTRKNNIIIIQPNGNQIATSGQLV